MPSSLPWGYWPLSVVGAFALLMVFPDGLRRGWVWAVAPFAYAAATGALIFALWGARNDTGRVVAVQSSVQTAINVLGIVVIAACLAVGIASVAAAYRAGDEGRRLQIRWLVLAGIVTAMSLLAGWIGGALGLLAEAVYAPFIVSVVVLLPLSVGIAVIRHDLFDVDRILSETAAWMITLVASSAVFAGVVFVIVRSLGSPTGTAAVAATFVTSLILLPLHRFLSSAISRVIDRDRTVAVDMVQHFTADVRAGLRQPEEVESVLRTAQRDDRLSVHVASANGWTDLAGRPVSETTGFAIQSGGDTVARIRLGRDSARARRRIADLARHAWLPIEISRLRLGLRAALHEVEASRTRLVEASALERQRLERDLHDGRSSASLPPGCDSDCCRPGSSPMPPQRSGPRSRSWKARWQNYAG